MELPVLDMQGATVDSLAVSDHLFGVPMNEPVVHQAMLMQRANARQGTHSVKTRANVTGGGAKPWRQKGTGRARQGSTRAPQFAGGGTVHGPQPRSYDYKKIETKGYDERLRMPKFPFSEEGVVEATEAVIAMRCVKATIVPNSPTD